VFEDASILVEGNILVNFGDEMKYGIFRNIPTTYQDIFGNRAHIDLEVIDVTQDEAKVTYKIYT